MAETKLCFSRVVTAPYPKDEQGRPLCRWCRGPVKPPKRTFCSPECVHEHSIRANTGYARQQVENRDKGICKTCGTDTEKLRASVDVWTWDRENHEPRRNPVKESKRAFDERWQVWSQRRMLARARLEVEAGLLKQKGWPGVDRSWWEMDHIVEVVNGGGGCGLDNLQTLCVLCHRSKTRKLVKCARA